MGHLGLEVFGEQGGPGLLEDGSCDLGRLPCGDEQLGEEALVGQPSGLRSAEAVDLIAAAYESECFVEGVSILA